MATLGDERSSVRRHDDTDGLRDDTPDLSVVIGPDGDAGGSSDTGGMLRFRTWTGGGYYLRARNALLVLAKAIRRDNADAPQPL